MKKENKSIGGWGNYPKHNSKIISLSTYQKATVNNYKNIIPRGLGRSYGDSSLNETVLDVTSSKKIISFDKASGIITCECGISLTDILSIIIPEGWFLPVTPGTKFITIGGAIAADVHGKNHHGEGSFCDYLLGINILTGSGENILCNEVDNPDLFYATCGGMGLTGIILTASFKLKKISGNVIDLTIKKTRNLTQTLEVLEQTKNYTYSVAWIDCLKKNKNIGRSIIMLGEHQNQIIKQSKLISSINIPFYTPSFALNKFSLRVFNSLYYNSYFKNIYRKKVHYDPYFYPLDTFQNWNRLYGKKGFFQYQFVVPFSVGIKGMHQLMKEIVNSGFGSFLAVLKMFGEKNQNILTFPISGYTLAIDIKYDKNAFRFFDYLDKKILDMGGRLYLAKDSRMSEETFKLSYSNWEKFQTIRVETDTVSYSDV